MTWKERILDTLIGILVILLAAVGGYWCASLPLYIFRGIYMEFGEMREVIGNLIIGTVGVPMTALFLLLYYRRTDRAERLTRKEAWSEAALSTGVYAVAQLLMGIFMGNNVLLARSAYFLALSIGRVRDVKYPAYIPTISALLVTTLISCTLYLVATVAGMRLAVRRRQRELAKMKESR